MGNVKWACAFAAIPAVAIALFTSTADVSASLSPTAASAKTACEKYGVKFGEHVTLVASYPSTGSAIRAWAGGSMNPFNSKGLRLTVKQQSSPVAACFLKGQFDSVPLAPGVRPYTNAVVIVAESSGYVRLVSAGHGNSWEKSPPPSGSSAIIVTRPEGPIILTADSVGPIYFGTPTSTTIADLGTLLGNSKSKRAPGGGCGLDAQVSWPNFMAYFESGKFVGYQSANDAYLSLHPKYIDAQTKAGLWPGDTITEAKQFYGSAFVTSSAQGGSWSVMTRAGKVVGLLKEPPVPTGPSDQIADIGAGYFGCPAMAP